MKIKATIVTLVGSAISANAAFLVTGTDLALGDGSGITYTVTGDVGTETGDGAGNDFRTSTDAGGSFTITFTGGTVDLSIFNSEINQAVNFDGVAPGEGYNAQIVADSGTWSYSAGDLDLTNGNNGGANVVSGLGSSTFTIGNARIFTDNNGDNVANSGAPFSQSDWGTFSISGVSSITYNFSNVTNFEGFRIDAVAAVPEPSSTALLGLGGLAMILRRRRA